MRPALLTPASLRHVAATEGLLTAWLDWFTQNWGCDECGAPGTCPHLATDDLALSAISGLLGMIHAILGAHRSTSRIAEALGATGPSTATAECTECALPWPCPTIADAQAAAAPLLDEWMRKQRWHQQPRPRTEPRREAPPAGTDRVRCPHCGKDVTRGIDQWRAAVTAAHRYVQRLDLRIDDSIERPSPGLSRDGQGGNYHAWGNGLQLARSHAHTEFNALLYSHHAHLDFVVAERDAGRIPATILV